MTKNMNMARLMIYAGLLFFCLVYLMPLFVMVITSFKTLPDIKAGNPDVVADRVGMGRMVQSVGQCLYGRKM